MFQGLFLISFRCLGVSKRRCWFWGSVDRLKNPENIAMRVLGCPISKSKSYKTNMDQNNNLELLSFSSLKTYHKNGKNMTEQCINYFADFVHIDPFFCPPMDKYPSPVASNAKPDFFQAREQELIYSLMLAA